jgi:hypothetical protein
VNLAKWWAEQSVEKQAEIDRRAVVLDPNKDLGVSPRPARQQGGAVGSPKGPARPGGR